METFIFAHSTSGLPILGYRFGQSHGPETLVLGGVHGDEIEGVWAAHGILQRCIENFDLDLQLTVVPAFNLDGVLARERRNHHGVDLNRNLPTRDWTGNVKEPRYFPGPHANSESENQFLARFIESKQPSFIVSLHSWKPMLNINGDCRIEAEAIHKLTGYTIEETIGYPTPGCLGTYAGIERKSPTLTYEIERGLDQASVLRIHVPAVWAALHAHAQVKSRA